MVAVILGTAMTAVYVMNGTENTSSGASDTVPPASITNLTLSRLNDSSVKLRWTAPGDDGNSGTALKYDIKYSHTVIDTDEKFANAAECIGEPTPAAAHAIQRFNVTDLTANTDYYFAIKTADEVPNWSPLSNSPVINIDTIPPSAVSDLTPVFSTNSSVELHWTAAGDDGSTGTAAQYDLRFSSSIINSEARFATATPCAGEPAPASAGSTQRFNITSLMKDEIRYFALKTADEVPNWSPFANTTGVPPDFTLNDTGSSPWNLYTHIASSKPILLEFMHPDCSPCKAAVPSLLGIYNNYSSGLEMVSVAITLEISGFRNPPTAPIVVDFKTQYGAVWTYLVETSGTRVRDLYSVNAIPTYFLIGRDGRIAYKQIGMGAWDVLTSEIEKALLP